MPLDASYKEHSEFKICKFLEPFDCLVAADIEGFLHFFAVNPSPRKNEHLCKVSNVNTSQVGTMVNYPIRAIDFDSVNQMLYTGDEMGYIQRWDLNSLFAKLNEVSVKEAKTSSLFKKELTSFDEKLDSGAGSMTFVTGVETGAASGLPGTQTHKSKVEF